MKAIFRKPLFYALLIMVIFGIIKITEYEKVNINDPDMALGDKTIKRFETSAQAYREAASGANGGKTGGGCGCN